MQYARKDLLREILTVINYRKDKEKFIKEFESTHYLESLANMLERLPDHLRDFVKVKAEQVDEEALKNYISSEEYFKEVGKVAEQALNDFIAVISPILTIAQKQKIDQLIRQYRTVH